MDTWNICITEFDVLKNGILLRLNFIESGPGKTDLSFCVLCFDYLGKINYFVFKEFRILEIFQLSPMVM